MLTLLFVGEFPLLAWMNGRVDKTIVDRVPGLHDELPVRRARMAFERAVAADSTATASLEALVRM